MNLATIFEFSTLNNKLTSLQLHNTYYTHVRMPAGAPERI